MKRLEEGPLPGAAQSSPLGRVCCAVGDGPRGTGPSSGHKQVRAAHSSYWVLRERSCVCGCVCMRAWHTCTLTHSRSAAPRGGEGGPSRCVRGGWQWRQPHLCPLRGRAGRPIAPHKGLKGWGERLLSTVIRAREGPRGWPPVRTTGQGQDLHLSLWPVGRGRDKALNRSSRHSGMQTEDSSVGLRNWLASEGGSRHSSPRPGRWQGGLKGEEAGGQVWLSAASLWPFLCPPAPPQPPFPCVGPEGHT